MSVKSVPAIDPVRAALTEIRDRVLDEEWWDSRGVCEHPFHTTHCTKHEEGQERCPRCFSSWWSTDGSLPGGPQYAMEAVAHAALAAEHEPVGITDEMVERAAKAGWESMAARVPAGYGTLMWAEAEGTLRNRWLDDMRAGLSAALSEARTEDQRP